ncbi:MAG TPA: Xaa-Pro peptidase family protein [Planctomycetota bacterium]|nr:Xaa-Pro peptidase family protein [Planctomycetota bacterium]
MLTAEGSRRRMARFRERLAERWGAGWDAAVIHRPEHLLYLANFFPLPNSLNLRSSSFLLVERDGPATLFTDNWLAQGNSAAVDEVVVRDWYTCIGPAENRAIVVGDEVQKKLRSRRVQTLLGELGHLPQHVASAASRLIEVEDVLRGMREIKDPDELDAIRRGIRTAEAGHAAARELIRPGMTELELYAGVVARAIVAAGAPFVMMCDLASGPRAAEGGGAPTSRVLEDGELVIVDLFPYVEGYRGDITNTLVVGGRPTPEQQALFDLVFEGLAAAEELLRPGTPVSEVYRVIDQVFRDESRHARAQGKRSLGHHAGHAIGLGHPEAPELVPESDRKLEAGMVLTLEPGIYGAPTGGVRLEHDYLVTETAPERLSRHVLGLV